MSHPHGQRHPTLFYRRCPKGLLAQGLSEARSATPLRLPTRYPVVKQIEAEFRFILRLSIQFDPRFPYFSRCFKTHVNYLLLPFFTNLSLRSPLVWAFLTLPASRNDSRRRMAGGELRLGTDATYMLTE